MLIMKVFAFAMSLLLLGCVEQSVRVDKASNNSDPVPTEKLSAKFEYHGEFCGPGHPTRRSDTDLGKLEELVAIAPRDSIDLACRNHDICYTVFGRDLYCDDVLVNEIRRMEFQETVRDKCHALGRNVVDYFELINPAKAKNEIHITVGSAVFKGIGLVVNVPLAAGADILGLQHGELADGEYCDDTVPVKDRWPDRRIYMPIDANGDQCVKRSQAAYVMSAVLWGKMPKEIPRYMKTKSAGIAPSEISMVRLDVKYWIQWAHDSSSIPDHFQVEALGLSDDETERIRVNINNYPEITPLVHSIFEGGICAAVQQHDDKIRPVSLGDKLAGKLKQCTYFDYDMLDYECAMKHVIWAMQGKPL